MTADQPHATIVAALFAPLPAIILATVVSVSRRAVDGRLPPNKTSRIRTTAAMSSDRAWVAAHRTALRLTPLLVAVTVSAWIVLFATAWIFPTVLAAILAGVTTGVAVTAALIYAAYVANKAAKTVSDGSDGRLQ
jgi:SdpI/YfhL protein family